MRTLQRLPLLGLAVLFSTAAGTLRAQPPTLTYEALSDWSWYSNMAAQAFQSGDYETAAHRYSMAIEKMKPYRETKLRLLVKSYYGMTRALHAQKRYAEAEPLARWVVEMRKADPAVKPDALFDSLYILALIRREQHHDAQAEPLFHEVLQIEEKALGPNSLSLTGALYDLASVEFKLEKYDRAELHLRRALLIYKRYGQTRSPGYVDALERYAKVLDQLDRGDDARAAEAAVEQLRAELESAKDQPAKSEFQPAFGVAAGVRPAAP